ncbi:MAG: shikimate dehydrogenase [Chloroflexi bacterium]|nr:shikimate dehydrogenase [Chloroflexota bacterium]
MTITSAALLPSGHTAVVGVIGWPVEHSVSPQMHNAALRALGLDWCYVPFAVPPERLTEAVRGLRALGLRGINATVPHKQALLPLMDALTPEARAIGAVNTLVMRPEGLLGHNTDAQGFLRALREAGFEPAGCRALVLGAGGVARAIVYALLSVGASVTLLNRSAARAEQLAHEFETLAAPGATLSAGALESATASASAARAHLVVNATSAGMWPAVERSPWPTGARLAAGAFCYDVVYNPRETLWLRTARAGGCAVADGLGMLVHQGAEALELWTGERAPVSVMRAACEAALGGA